MPGAGYRSRASLFPSFIWAFRVIYLSVCAKMRATCQAAREGRAFCVRFLYDFKAAGRAILIFSRALIGYTLCYLSEVLLTPREGESQCGREVRGVERC